ncbi:DUF2163 domain-containing protein [Paracoccus suum]|uniref:DUF2163 domain-containing protein n=1 Tax=Paracoccus suum TaxID=2259340 RepID=A0A344PLA0_9RHOB|nr:DUF2163 domain-containing protein [Paracoccus suum]AXC50155.1 DUF2163 domain-containing protein [Paracoccus suum]
MSALDQGTTRARAWAVTRADGLVLGFTDHDVALEFEGIRFRPDTGMSAAAVMQSSGLSVDNSEAAGMLSDDAITEADLQAGRWDAADVRLWEVDWAKPAARQLVFRGALGEVTRQGSAFKAELRGLSEALNRPQGRVYHPRCPAVLGDSACRMNLGLPGYRADTVAVAVEEGRVFRIGGLPGYDLRWFERGTLEVTSGAAKGLRGAIKRDLAMPDGGREIELWAGIGAAVAAGDGLRLTAGCDKQPDTCRLKFNNYLNFRGFPHLPSEDWLTAPKATGGRARPAPRPGTPLPGNGGGDLGLAAGEDDGDDGAGGRGGNA